MDDVTMARLLAKHALGYADAIDAPCDAPLWSLWNGKQVFVVHYDGGDEELFDPANVTDHAIEAAEAARDNCLVHGWAVRDTSTSVWRWEAKGSFTVRCHEEPRHAARLALATLRALGIEEEERRNHNGVASDVVHEDLEDR